MVKTPAERARYFPAYSFWNLELTHSGQIRRGLTKNQGLLKLVWIAQRLSVCKSHIPN